MHSCARDWHRTVYFRVAVSEPSVCSGTRQRTVRNPINQVGGTSVSLAEQFPDTYTDLAVGSGHMCVIRSDQSVKCVGYNGNRELARSGCSKSPIPGRGDDKWAGRHGFLITAIDGDLKNSDRVDRFRLKVWGLNAGNTVAYDNQWGTAEDSDAATTIGGGRIVIHK